MHSHCAKILVRGNQKVIASPHGFSWHHTQAQASPVRGAESLGWSVQPQLVALPHHALFDILLAWLTDC
jgi:hypothetical protein